MTDEKQLRLIMIRHGESEADLLDVCEGRADFELTERGHRQAQRMAEWVSRRYDIDRIYCSTLRRARQTAEHLAARTGLSLTPDERLMEFNNGLLAGLPRGEAAARYPEIPGLPLHEARYEMESMLEFRARAEYMLSKLIAEGTDGSTTAVVAHGGMIAMLYRAFLRLPVDDKTAFCTADAGVHEWCLRGERRMVVFANRFEEVE